MIHNVVTAGHNPEFSLIQVELIKFKFNALFTSLEQKKMLLYLSKQKTTCHSGNLEPITPHGESKIFVFACKHQSHFHPLANQTKSDQAIKRLSVTPRGAFQSWGGIMADNICNHPKSVVRKTSVLHRPSEHAYENTAAAVSVRQRHQVFLITVLLHYGNNGQSSTPPTGTL